MGTPSNMEAAFKLYKFGLEGKSDNEHFCVELDLRRNAFIVRKNGKEKEVKGIDPRYVYTFGASVSNKFDRVKLIKLEHRCCAVDFCRKKFVNIEKEKKQRMDDSWDQSWQAWRQSN